MYPQVPLSAGDVSNRRVIIYIYSRAFWFWDPSAPRYVKFCSNLQMFSRPSGITITTDSLPCCSDDWSHFSYSTQLRPIFLYTRSNRILPNGAWLRNIVQIYYMGDILASANHKEQFSKAWFYWTEYTFSSSFLWKCESNLCSHDSVNILNNHKTRKSKSHLRVILQYQLR